MEVCFVDYFSFLLGLVGITSAKKFFSLLRKFRINFKIFIIISSFVFVQFFFSQISVPRLGSFESSTNIQTLLSKKKKKKKKKNYKPKKKKNPNKWIYRNIKYIHCFCSMGCYKSEAFDRYV